jgi:hypothetical protein
MVSYYTEISTRTFLSYSLLVVCPCKDDFRCPVGEAAVEGPAERGLEGEGGLQVAPPTQA